MFNKFTICMLLFVFNWGPGAWAQDRHFEITPLVGFRGGGAFQDALQEKTLEVDESAVYGLTIEMDYDATGQIHLLWSHQSTDFNTPSALQSRLYLDIDYIHFGGSYSWAMDEKYRPYLALSVGLTHFQPTDFGYNDEWRFSMGVGLGLKYFITPRIGLMLEGRWFGTFMGGAGVIFCNNTSCQIEIEQELFGQFDARTGIVFRF